MKRIILSGLVFISTITSLQAQIYTPSGTILGTSTTSNVGIGTANPSCSLTIRKTPGENDAHLFFGEPMSVAGEPAAKLCFGGTGIQNAGLVWIPGTTSENGKLHLSYGGYENPIKNPIRMTFQSNGNIGIGTTNPVKLLDIQNSNSGAGESYIWIKKGIDATNVNREAGIILGAGSGDYGNTFKIAAMSSTGYFDAPKLSFKYTNPGGSKIIDLLTFDSLGKVGIGTTNPDAKLTVNGNIHAQEVKIDLLSPMTVPDYVFASDYKLKTLKEVEDYVNKNSHLPEIPSAKELEKNGLMLAEMNMSLLKKVEELTLYAIEQEKRTEALIQFTKEQENRMKIQLEAIENLKRENEHFKNLSERLSIIEKGLENNTVHSK